MLCDDGLLLNTKIINLSSFSMPVLLGFHTTFNVPFINGANKDDVLIPGDFVKVIVTSKVPTQEILVPQASTLNDAAGYYVWSYDENNQAIRKNIKVGQEIDKKWVVLDGLTADDNYIAKGIQSIRMPGQKINPQPLEEETTEETK